MARELIESGWFREKEVFWKGQAFSLQVKEVLCDFKSEYQHIIVFDSVSYGRVLVLDGVIQLTEKDECGYQEMITHVPMNSHNSPKNILIIGGGDGGVLREVAKYSSVEYITLCDIDKEVINTSKKYFSETMAVSFNDPRLKLVHEDGFKFLDSCISENQKFDVILVDSSDPIGPAESLYKEEFYQKMKLVLASDGIICMQGENMYLHLHLIKELLSFCQKLFPSIGYFNTLVPTYPSGSIGFVLCSLEENNKFTVKEHRVTDIQTIQSKLKYYNPKVHEASFILPQFVTEEIKQYFK